ncbi:MAG: hypothetical protein AB7O65_01395 [Candidatus Korobacteraceae bacterium]
MRRPFGITVLAILSLVLGLFYLVAGIGFIFSGGPVTVDDRFASMNPRLGWLFLPIALVDLLAAYGLWKLRGWGWGLMLALIATNLLAALGALAAGYGGSIGPLLSLAVNGLVMWYLLKRDVRAAFAAADAGENRLGKVA